MATKLILLRSVIIILALKVILLDRLQGNICSVILATLALTVHVVVLGRDRCPGVPTSELYLLCVCMSVCVSVCVHDLPLGLGPMRTLYAYTCRKGPQHTLDPTMHSHTIDVRTLG